MDYLDKCRILHLSITSVCFFGPAFVEDGAWDPADDNTGDPSAQGDIMNNEIHNEDIPNLFLQAPTAPQAPTALQAPPPLHILDFHDQVHYLIYLWYWESEIT